MKKTASLVPGEICIDTDWKLVMGMSTERCCKGLERRTCEFTGCVGDDWGRKEEEEMSKESFRILEKEVNMNDKHGCMHFIVFLF